MLQALQASAGPMSAAEVSTAVGISRAAAQRHLATLSTAGEATMRLRCGTIGRAEEEFLATSDGSNTAAG